MGGNIWAKCNNNQMSTTIHKQWEHGYHSGPLSGFLQHGQAGSILRILGEREEHQGEGKRLPVAAEV